MPKSEISLKIDILRQFMLTKGYSQEEFVDWINEHGKTADGTRFRMLSRGALQNALRGGKLTVKNAYLIATAIGVHPPEDLYVRDEAIFNPGTTKPTDLDFATTGDPFGISAVTCLEEWSKEVLRSGVREEFSNFFKRKVAERQQHIAEQRLLSLASYESFDQLLAIIREDQSGDQVRLAIKVFNMSVDCAGYKGRCGAQLLISPTIPQPVDPRHQAELFHAVCTSKHNNYEIGGIPSEENLRDVSADSFLCGRCLQCMGQGSD